MRLNRRRWPLLREAVGPCESWWQYSQALPILQVPLAMRTHGRLHKSGWPRLPLLSAPGSMAVAVGSGSIVCSVSPDGGSADSFVGRALISCTSACISASDLTDSDASCPSASCSCSCSSVSCFVPKAGQLRERDIITFSTWESSSMKVLKYRKFVMPTPYSALYSAGKAYQLSSRRQGKTAELEPKKERAGLSIFWVSGLRDPALVV